MTSSFCSGGHHSGTKGMGTRGHHGGWRALRTRPVDRTCSSAGVLISPVGGALFFHPSPVDDETRIRPRVSRVATGVARRTILRPTWDVVYLDFRRMSVRLGDRGTPERCARARRSAGGSGDDAVRGARWCGVARARDLLEL